MNDGKIIIIGVILAVVVGGSVWFFNQGDLSKEEPNTGGQTEEETDNSVVNTGDYQDPYLGQSDAPVTILEYFSYGCGHCKTFHKTTLPALKAKYIDTGKVKYIARQLFGIEQFPQAALCAAEQAKFWDFHDYLFDHAAEVTKPEDLSKLKDFAAVLGLDQAKFDSCFDENRYAGQVAQWAEDGQALGLKGVPAFYVNGQPIMGNQPLSKFEEIIDQELNK